MRPLAAALLALSALAAGASAQTVSTTTVVSTATFAGRFGIMLDVDKGPWVLGEVLFFSAGRVVSQPAWRDHVRGRVGSLYTKPDIISDVESLKTMGVFDKVEWTLFEIAGSPVPTEFYSISSSTSEVRLVFNVAEKPPPPAPAVPKSKTPPAPISGVMLTPTAYRGLGRFTTPGLGLDFNAMYFIGTLYGKNHFENTVRKTDYISRLGVWLLTADAKMQVQSESTLRPAVAVGAQGAFVFRDSPQPTVNTPTVSVQVSNKTTQLLTDGYVVASKNIHGVRASVGYMEGNIGNIAANLSEFLTPQSLEFYAGRKGTTVVSRNVPFASLLYHLRPEYPLGIEVMKFNGAALNPLLINLKLGYFLKLNFDISYLKFNGGYQFLGTFQFRYSQFPRR